MLEVPLVNIAMWGVIQMNLGLSSVMNANKVIFRMQPTKLSAGPAPLDPFRMYMVEHIANIVQWQRIKTGIGPLNA